MVLLEIEYFMMVTISEISVEYSTELRFSI